MLPWHPVLQQHQNGNCSILWGKDTVLGLLAIREQIQAAEPTLPLSSLHLLPTQFCLLPTFPHPEKFYHCYPTHCWELSVIRH